MNIPNEIVLVEWSTPVLLVINGASLVAKLGGDLVVMILIGCSFGGR